MREGTNAVERQQLQLDRVAWLRTVEAGAHELGEELAHRFEIVERHHRGGP